MAETHPFGFDISLAQSGASIDVMFKEIPWMF